jgi:DNA-directed RNA polymerase specialized sigma24 family protein
MALERSAAARQAVGKLRAAIRTLAPRERAIATMHLELEYAPLEIADTLSMTPNAARVALHRVLEKPRTAVGDVALPHDLAVDEHPKEQEAAR